MTVSIPEVLVSAQSLSVPIVRLTLSRGTERGGQVGLRLEREETLPLAADLQVTLLLRLRGRGCTA